MNYRITLKVQRTASEADVRKRLKLPEDQPVTRHDVEQFGRIWQEQVAGSNDGSEMIANAEAEVSVVW